MSLNTAHEGYEYQDLLTAYFILDEILSGYDSSFKIDAKEHDNDKFDDLTIVNQSDIFKRQIKYSNETVDHTASKDDFATSNAYDLAFYDLFKSWKQGKTNNIRLCLAWNEPVDKLINFLKPSTKQPTFDNHQTNVFEINLETLWPENEHPESSWQKFKAESANIDRQEFSDFCEHLVIETNFPKQSKGISFSGELEAIVLEQIQRLGIGEYPNKHATPENFALELCRIITRSRSRGLEIKTKDIFEKLNIQTDYGSIEQVFPVDHNKNISTEDNILGFIEKVEALQHVVLKGEPGSGKSWFVQNLENKLAESNIRVVRHYCYTDLKDRYTKERITLDVFCGNLIKDILEAFPYLEEKKQQRYASNLSELNELLKNIDTETYLIIDGLDHIDRVYSFSQADLTLDDVAIIEAITKLQVSDKVKVVVVSQPIEALDMLTNYHRIGIPKWSRSEVQAYFSKNEIGDVEIEDGITLLEVLLAKSDGNPLYLSYLTKEVKTLTSFTIKAINDLPPYSYNLQDYYKYLITKLDVDSIVPQVLSGTSFSLTRGELKEITGQGKRVDKALATLSPVLRENCAYGGFMIYHESFRRFIIEGLKEDEVDINKAIFNPLIEWLEEKGFFDFQKAYRYYLSLLYNVGNFEAILNLLMVDFVTKSISYGHSFEAVKNNYQYFAKSAIQTQDFPAIILVSEINKILNTTEDEFYESHSIYYDAMGHLRGFQTVSDYLIFDEKPTLPLKVGLEACYLCDQNKQPAPWDVYCDYFEKGKNIELSDFKYFIRGLLVKKDKAKLLRVANKAFQYAGYVEVFSKELNEYNDKDYVDELQKSNSIFDQIINYKKQAKIQSVNLNDLASQLLDIDSMLGEEEVTLLKSFFAGIRQNVNNQQLIKDIIDLFKANNWFYNWVIYYIKLICIQEKTTTPKFSEIKEALQYLIYDTEPFKGKPRTCDLYKAKPFIQNSIQEVFSLTYNTTEWGEVIDIVVEAGVETTTGIQRSIEGPIAVDKLFQLLAENANQHNRHKIIEVFEQLIIDKRGHYLHSYIAEFYFALSKQYSITKKTEKAEQTFTKGVECALGYTFRKDRTLEDTLEAIESYTKVFPKEGQDDIKNVKSLVDAVVNHTDGKSTKSFPMEWFQNYLNINFEEASLYLLSQIKKTYFWVYEEQLRDLLIKANGNVNSVVELFLFLTFPIEASEDFLSYGLNLVKKNKKEQLHLSKILLDSIIQRTKAKKNKELSDAFIANLNDVLTDFNLDIKFKSTQKTNYKEEREIIKEIKANVPRKGLLEMTIQEMTDFFSVNLVKESELMSLYYYFDNIDQLNPELEDLIGALVRKQEDYSTSKKVDLSVIFQKKNDVSAYFWISKFNHQQGGWFEKFVNAEAFREAHTLNSELAINALAEHTKKLIESIGYTRMVSGNLLNALVNVGYDKEVIKRGWQMLYDATDHRLPFKEIIDWDELLTNELNLNTEEIFICLLFTRFNSNTTERHHWTLSGLVYLYEMFPEKMIKPTKWFFKNTKSFLTTNLIIILEILYDKHTKNNGYTHNFIDELKNLPSSGYYLINYILDQLIPQNSRLILAGTSFSFQVPNEEVKYCANINYRNEILYNKGFDFENIVGKFKASFKHEYNKDSQFLYNLSVEKFVKNIYPANYWFELINQEFAEDFENAYDQEGLYEYLQVNYQTIVGQTLSFIRRPNDIKRPSEINQRWFKDDVKNADWIRLGYHECELFGRKHNDNKVLKVFEGVIFDDSLTTAIFPYSSYRLYPIDFFDKRKVSGFDEYLCTMLLQEKDTLEDYMLLWLNTLIINKLDLKINNPIYGLVAKNENDEVVLKFNRWSSSYVGDGDIAGITDEIPRLEGAELICRKDYFDKICQFFPAKPYHYRLKMS